MRQFLLVAAAILAFGCSNDPGVVRSETKDGTDIARATEPIDSGAAKPPVGESVPTRPAEPGPDKKTEPQAPGRIDPRVVGTYRLELSSEQKAQIEESLAQLRRQAKTGDSRSQQLLSVAETAAKAAENMTFSLTADGRFSSEVATGPSKGKFTMSGTTLTLMPDEAPADPSIKNAMEFEFDPAAKTLTAEQNGQKTVFRRVR
ncbi:MAG: hypothetical protein KF884_03090 [Fimbriimonadaceae bacterium]|nr:hypothetical protein [Fimbriimonadaceae bacterium]QYK59082.1 MAG: hypothetical protein KF884_03090 [Fimbriimonadaceae bacterium]